MNHPAMDPRAILLTRMALESYKELLESDTSADRSANGDEWADQACDDIGAILANEPALAIPEVPEEDLEEFVHSYKVAALWSTTSEDGGNLDDDHDEDDIAEETATVMRSDCEDFIRSNWLDLLHYCDKMENEEYTGWQRAGHDFWLTRNGHGAGFWDRGLGELGKRLTAAAKVYKEVYLYAGDDGKIHS